MTIVLTDDELVAIAVEQGAEWFGNLPTVETSDVTHLANASARGFRSLTVRSLLSAKGESRLDSTLLAALGPAVGNRPDVFAYLADSRSPLSVTGASIAVFALSDTESTLVVTLADGINEVKVLGRAEALLVAWKFVNQVFRDGFPTPSDEDTREIVALFIAGGRSEALLVTQGVARIANIAGSGEEVHLDGEEVQAAFPDHLFGRTA
jgi:hypothetical protein